jgi:glycosyltransferase involved in cell wall biosynthesis
MTANKSHMQPKIENNIPIDISVVMPLFNKGKEVARAIRSVLNQTVKNYELIVVNDGSADDGPKIVQSFCDPRIRLIHQQNAGVSVARNHGIEDAKSDLIAFLDADDEWLPDFLETITRLRSRFSSCSVFATNYLYRNIDGSLMPTIIRGLPGAKWEGILEHYFEVASQSDPPLWSSAVAVTKEAVTSIGGFPVGVKAGEDLLTWAKLALKYKIAYSTGPRSVFYLRESLWGRPTRIPSPVDVIGKEFERILEVYKNGEPKGLKEYIARWHQMRASIYLRLGKQREAIYEAKNMARYSQQKQKLYIFVAVTLLPQRICDWILRGTNYLKYYRRTVLSKLGSKNFIFWTALITLEKFVRKLVLL